MSLKKITAFKPTVNREDAVRFFNSSGISKFIRDLQIGRLRSIADVYVPFRIYRVDIDRGATRDSKLIGIDAISGSLDPFVFESLPNSEQLVSVETRNRPEALLPEAEAEKVLRLKIQRLLFQVGFFRMRNLKITIHPVLEEIHMPYWVGFYGNGATAQIRVLDATRCRFEGAKLRKCISDWLLA